MINRLKELRRKPGKLVLYLFVLAAIVGLILLTLRTGDEPQVAAPIFWLTGILFALIALMTVLTVRSGLSSGDAIFEMNDVNLLFVSPVSPRKILLYGIARMAKTALLTSFFILFQSSAISSFGAGYGGVLITFAGYVLSILVLTIVSLLIYSKTNGRPGRKRLIKIVTVALFVPLLNPIVTQYILSRDIIIALEAMILSPYLRFFPVAGWAASGVTAFLSGELLSGFFFFGLNLLLGACLTVYILLSNPDYYEDVLVATETAYEKQRAAAEGDINAVLLSKRKVKITKTGIRGEGAAALFGKHVRESFRQSRLGFLSLSSVLVVVGAGALSYFVSDLLIILQILMWIKLFTIGVGRGLKETYSHYIYMIPEPSFSKILWSNMEPMAKTLVEGVLVFAVSGIVIAASPLLVIACILAYTLFALLLLGVNYLYMRLTGADISSGILITIYFVAVAVFIAPGIVLGVLTASVIGGGVGAFLGVFVLALWELAVGLGCLALSKGVLHNCDMTSLKPS